jgi:transglutaminase-like putative cysteine protease
MQRLRIFHETEYRYHSPVTLGRHRILVRPRDGHDVRIEESRLGIEPAALVSWHRDELDNSVALATFNETPTTRLIITSEVVVAHYLSLRTSVPLVDRAISWPFQYIPEEKRALSAYVTTLAHDAAFSSWVSQTVHGIDSTMTLLSRLSQHIFDNFDYQLRDEEGVQLPDETLSRGSGSCRDYAWLFIEACRMLGLAARFVSGYFHPKGTALNDGATHAWAEVYLPGAGWTGFDPTCNRMAAENHVPVAVALLPEDIPPVSGVFTGPVGEQPEMRVTVHVTPC